MDKVSSLIQENIRTKLPFLDLGNCGLEYAWPEEILECEWLEGINFSVSYYDDFDNEDVFTSNKGLFNAFTGNEGFERLKQLPCLRSLHLSITGLKNIEFLRSLPRLKILTIGSNPLTDIRPITTLRHLYHLNVAGAKFSDFSPLGELPELRYLYLSGDPNSVILPITNLSDFRSLKKLKNLTITHSLINDIRDLAALKGLEYADLSSNKIRSVDGIQELYNLKELNLSHNNIPDLLPLHPPTYCNSGIVKLKLDDNKIQYLDIRALDSMLHLNELSIYNNSVKNVPNDTLHYGTIGQIRGFLRRNG